MFVFGAYVVIVAYELALTVLGGGLLWVGAFGELDELMAVSALWLRVPVAAAGLVILYRVLDELVWAIRQRRNRAAELQVLADHPHEARRGKSLIGAAVVLLCLGLSDQIELVRDSVQVASALRIVFFVAGVFVLLGGILAQKSSVQAVAEVRAAKGHSLEAWGVLMAVVDESLPHDHLHLRLKLKLRVEVPGFPPYETDWEGSAPRTSAGMLRPGERLKLKVDRQDRRLIVIDWNAPPGSVGAPR
jgi:hypothetical protein